jgi:hypothetical protein
MGKRKLGGVMGFNTGESMDLRKVGTALHQHSSPPTLQSDKKL